MAAETCWTCCLRPQFAIRTRFSSCQSRPLQPAALFSTSATLEANPIKARPRTGQAITVQKGSTLRIKKKGGANAKSGRPPAPGERKAFRKRLVLSNPNALEIKDLQTFNADFVEPEKIEECVGDVTIFDGETVDQLRALEAFKPSQRWSRFRRPGTLITNESVRLAKLLDNVQKSKKVDRRVYTGERGSGKSVLLLQAMAMAMSKGWIVVSIPEARELAINHTMYRPLPNSEAGKYVQLEYIRNLLGAISKANAGVLSQLKLSQEHSLPVPIQSNISLDRLAGMASNDPDLAWPIFNAFWKEITAPSRPPILYILDGLADVMKATEYRDRENEQIHAHDFATIRHFLNHLSGAQTLPNGGAVLGATSGSNTPSVPTLDLTLKRGIAASSPTLKALARPANRGVPFYDEDPYATLDPRILSVMKDVAVTKLQGLDRAEARALLEYYARGGLTRAKIDEQRVAELRAVSGGGIVGEIERAVLGG